MPSLNLHYSVPFDANWLESKFRLIACVLVTIQCGCSAHDDAVSRLRSNYSQLWSPVAEVTPEVRKIGIEQVSNLSQSNEFFSRRVLVHRDAIKQVVFDELVKHGYTGDLDGLVKALTEVLPNPVEVNDQDLARMVWLIGFRTIFIGLVPEKTLELHSSTDDRIWLVIRSLGDRTLHCFEKTPAGFDEYICDDWF